MNNFKNRKKRMYKSDFLTSDQVRVENLAILVQIWIEQIQFVQKTQLKPKKAYKCDGGTKSPIHH